MGLTGAYGDYVAPHTLEMCYDMKNKLILKFMMLLKEKERLKLRIVVRF